MQRKDFNVAIVGGGMCGLACAIGLTRGGINVQVFEAASKFDEIGAGVGLGPNALRALEGLDLLDVVLQKANEKRPNQRLFCFVTVGGNHEKIYDYYESTSGEDTDGLGIYRPAFLEALMPLLDPTITQFNKRAVSVEKLESGRHLLHFPDNSTYEADLIIGADGIKSTTRSAVIGKGASPLGFSNTHAYRGLVPIETLKAAGVKTDVKRPHNWVGMGQHIITFPIRDDTILNIVAFNRPVPNTISEELPHPWVESVDQKELLDAYKGCGSEVCAILQHMKNPSRWSIHTLYPPLDSYVKDRVVLIGDAAHGMLPHLGAGVGQGFEDVYTLCRLLSHPGTNKSTLDAAIAVYNELRPPRANMVLQRSIDMGNIYDNYGPGGYTVQGMRERLRGMWEPVWNHDLEAQVTTAIGELERKNVAEKN
ncbi:salicylate hydroxylase [Pholiota conissans]|uniref:Salicylate hydroxylase n=1 Tax=Pholiota conissans TaxID=109636 RepID=A0A9P6D0G7_9AGAR|nr:salicylate hydroxylase [Pholiota conissans]